jgi:Ca-activated chloride channel homolog
MKMVVNKKNILLTSLIIFLFLFTNENIFGQKPIIEEPPAATTRILIIFDASQSMYGRWQENMKIISAQKLIGRTLDSLKSVENLELALRIFGHQKPFPPQDCDDTQLVVPFGKNNVEKIKHQLSIINPRGTTPITQSLLEARRDFPPCDNCRNLIILITDGIEECGGDPCEASRLLQKQGIALKPFVIGIGSDFSESLDCVGTYFTATDERDFTSALNVVISQALNQTTAQINLLDADGIPSETNVSMTFYDHTSGKVLNNYIHTLNNRGLPDTLILDPLVKYDIIVHTIPELTNKNVEIVSGNHNIIPFDAGQGTLKLEVGGNWRTLRNLQVIVRKHNRHQTLHVQQFGTSQKYLNGIYDLEILSLPRVYIDSVVIQQSHTTTIKIPMPGIFVLRRTSDGYGGIYLDENDKLELVYNLPESKGQTESLLLMPGHYRIIYRSKWLNKAILTIEEKFEIIEGKTTEIKINR